MHVALEKCQNMSCYVVDVSTSHDSVAGLVAYIHAMLLFGTMDDKALDVNSSLI